MPVKMVKSHFRFIDAHKNSSASVEFTDPYKTGTESLLLISTMFTDFCKNYTVLLLLFSTQFINACKKCTVSL